MQRSTERILTTHVGSLPRPPDLLEMINAKEEGRPFDLSRYRERVKSAVREAVEKQAAAGIDISADGEMGRVGFIPYVNERLSDIEPRQAARGQHQWRHSREYQAFPEYYEWASAIAGAAGQAPAVEWVCTGPSPIAERRHSNETSIISRGRSPTFLTSKPSCRRSPRRSSPIGTKTNTTRARKSTASPSPKRFARNTAGSWVRG